MSYPDHVIDAIDAALEDCTVGPDAMRWAPDPEPEFAPGGYIPGPGDALDRLGRIAVDVEPAAMWLGWLVGRIDPVAVGNAFRDVGEALARFGDHDGGAR